MTSTTVTINRTRAPSTSKAIWGVTNGMMSSSLGMTITAMHRAPGCGRIPRSYPNYAELGGEKMRLIAIAGFGLAALGIFTIFNSTSAPISFAACTMYIVGSVLGVLLLQIEIVSRGQGHSENSPEQHNALKG